jgi:phage shock protein E
MSNKQLTLREFHNMHLSLGKNDVILDVRNPEEYREAHIRGALNIPLSEVGHKAQELEKFENVYIHCKRGGRAQIAYQMLLGAGLTNLVCIGDAGMDLWIAEGFPCERGNNSET